MKSIMKEMVGGCCVCSDERGWPENPLVYCDGQGCTVAVHQACYGIVTVPTGPWYCRKCESQERSARVRCELCPSKDGALKRTDNSGWAHVVCALYIPEVRFGNVTTMEPIILQLIPTERFNKVCYICEELGKGGRSTVGACMQCNKSGCKQQFHVTCAQALGLLCEEAGNYLDNVKYCGYCQHHYSKLKKGGNVKTIPPYKPIPTDNHSSDSSPEKEAEAAVATKSSQPPSSSSSSSSRKSKSSSSNSKSSSSSSKSSTSTSKSSSSSASSHQKTVHNSSSSNKNVSNAEKSSSKNFSSAKSAAKNSESDLTNSVNAQIESDTKPVDKSSERSTPSSKDSSIATKFSNSNFSDSATPVSDSVFGDNRSDSNLSASSTKDIAKSSSKKRKAGSRTPTPNSVTPVETDKSVVNAVSATQNSVGVNQGAAAATPITSTAQDRRDSISSSETIEKPKKAKTEHPQPTSIPPIHHSITTPRTTSSPSVPSEPLSVISDAPPAALLPPVLPTTASVVQQPNSLVVSVPLANTSLSPIQQQQGVPHGPLPSVAVQHQLYSHLPPRTPPLNATTNGPTESALGISTSLDSTMVSSEANDGGLKITYEKQPTMNSSSLSRLATDNASSSSVVPEDVPAKRSRSQSADKTEKMGRPKKRGSNGVTTVSGPAMGAGKRVSRSQHSTPPPTTQPGAFSSVSQQHTPPLPPQPQPPPPQQQQQPPPQPQPQQVVKESPPSSPSDESNSVGSGRRTKGRKSAPATITSVSSSSSNTPTVPKPETKDMKDIKVFQNGVHAPHMLGNQLNPNSNMAQKMSDHLNSELEAHSIFNAAENSTNLVGPQLHSRVIASIRSNNSTSASNSSSGFSSMLGGAGGGTVPQTLDQLLERQWEQGSQFLMEQAQHFDIASLLSCLHQLRAENLRLEEHVNSLLQRRDHLLAVNARLAIPLTNQQPVAAPSQPHTLNNLHPSVTASHGDVPRSRHSSGSGYAGHTGGGAPPLENGLPLDGAAYPHQHRSPASSQPQPSPTIRHSPASSNYPSTSSHGIVRSGSVSEGSSRSSQRSQSQSSHSSYPQYQGQMPGVTPPQQPQMVMRRDTDVHHQMPSSKPS